MGLKNIHIRYNSQWDLVFLAFLLVEQTLYVTALASLETLLIVLIPCHLFTVWIGCMLALCRHGRTSMKAQKRDHVPFCLLGPFSQNLRTFTASATPLSNATSKATSNI